MIWQVAVPPNEPPQITVSALAEKTDAPIENETMTLQKRQTSAAATSQPVLSMIAFSDMALPTNFDAAADTALMSAASTSMGFGMSVTGFGDVGNMSAIPAGMRTCCSMSERMKRLRESEGDDRAEVAVRLKARISGSTDAAQFLRLAWMSSRAMEKIRPFAWSSRSRRTFISRTLRGSRTATTTRRTSSQPLRT